MTPPVVSVIMPVYNASKYLKKAIDSILSQTLSDFEFIIINDCSTDNSEEIILSYTDKRIIYIKQAKNLGVVAAMNIGLDMSKAPYIAVMHADDISLPMRLEKQVQVLAKNDDIAVVAGKSIFIDEYDNETGKSWEVDDKTKTAEEIKKRMIKENCISHPTVMMRSSVVKQYKYESSPDHIGYAVEDYPLWLNILSDGYSIYKVQEPMLYYRTHPTSATGTYLKKNNPFFVNYRTKKFYLEQRKRQNNISAFDKKVQFSMYMDFVKGMIKGLKNSFTQ